jgi:hypothetical protein
VTAHFFNQQQMIDGLLSVCYVAPREACDVTAPVAADSEDRIIERQRIAHHSLCKQKPLLSNGKLSQTQARGEGWRCGS